MVGDKDLNLQVPKGFIQGYVSLVSGVLFSYELHFVYNLSSFLCLHCTAYLTIFCSH